MPTFNPVITAPAGKVLESMDKPTAVMACIAHLKYRAPDLRDMLDVLHAVILDTNGDPTDPDAVGCADDLSKAVVQFQRDCEAAA